MLTYAAMDRDANYVPIQGPLSFLTSKDIVFDGTTGKGAQGTDSIFTVTGDVLVLIGAICRVDLVGAATFEVGVADNTARLIQQIANASLIIAPDSISSGGIDHVGELNPASSTNNTAIISSQDIAQTIGTTDITGGELVYYCFWRPLSQDGYVTAV